MLEAQPDDVELLRVTTADHRSRFRLACFPNTMDGAANYLALAELLLPTVEVLALRYQEYPSDRLADKCFTTLSGWTDRPLALLGHRAGAHLAYRVAARLEREAGVAVTTLFALDRGAPAPVAGEPRLSARIVAICSGRDTAAAAGWAAYTTASCVVERVPGRSGPHGNHPALANLIHDDLLAHADG